MRIRTVILLAALAGATALARAAYLPLEFGATSVPGTGAAFVAVWVSPVTTAMHHALVHLVVQESKGRRRKDRILAYTRLATGNWSRLSAWLPSAPGRRPWRRESLMLMAPSTDAVAITRATLRLPGGAAPIFTQGFLRVVGRTLCNSNGPIILRGVNVTAYADDKRSDHGQTLGMCCPYDYEQIAARGFNAIRLNCWYDPFVRSDGWAWLDLQIALARQHGLYLVLDMHAPPGGYQGPNYKGRFWRSRKLQRQLLAFWTTVAQRYHDEPVIAMYDLMNEPKPRDAAQWYAYARTLVAAIRAGGDAHAIAVEIEFRQGDVWERLADPAIVYDFHWYDPWEFAAQSAEKHFGPYGANCVLWGQPTVLDITWLRKHFDLYAPWTVSNNVPLQIGEYGIARYAQAPALRGLDWLRDTLTLFNEAGAARFYFSWYPYEFGLNSGWYRQDPGQFCEDAARMAAGN
jgi:hypothetical protein